MKKLFIIFAVIALTACAKNVVLPKELMMGTYACSQLGGEVVNVQTYESNKKGMRSVTIQCSGSLIIHFEYDAAKAVKGQGV